MLNGFIYRDSIMPVIKHTHLIGGIQTYVYKPSQSSSSVAILFLLHGRHGSAGDVDSVARTILEATIDQQQRNLWIVTLDHRNHGQRLVDTRANSGWTGEKISNDHHAMDMYSIQTGTAQDISFLIDFLPIYLFPHDDCKVDAWGIAGISLGGHSTWIALSRDPRLTVGIPIVGCPNYLELIKYRANNSLVPFQAPKIPNSLISLVNKSDPASQDFKSLDPTSNPFFGKKILVLSGKEDILVPWSASEAFVDALEVGPEGVKKVFLQRGVGHDCTKEMVAEAVSFIGQHMLMARTPASL